MDFGPNTKLTIERRDQVVLFGLNRPDAENRVDPETFQALAKAFYDYDHDPSLRAAVLFGHGERFSRGIDVEAYRAVADKGGPLAGLTDVINPLNYGTLQRKKPLIASVHGDTWNLGHELFLSADVRVAAVGTNFGQDENAHGRFPGGGSTVRFVRDAGWGNAMRYMLTGDHWTAEDAYRMGVLQEILDTPQGALDRAIEIAVKIAACAPLGVATTLASAHLAVDSGDAEAFSRLGVQYAALYRTNDFIEGRTAQAEGRSPVFHGN
ncbi:enoyl-CoA hydratase [Rhizobium sp. R635]|nr:enoyl-CoA hydratase [Rhizobium sp. R635]